VPFVHARVVLAERPTSAKPGDEALVLADGTIEGFVGGSCAEATVRDQSLGCSRRGESLLLRITPEPEPTSPASWSCTTTACRAARSRSSWSRNCPPRWSR
jgi:xanthine dehydrogenase accessory factor